MVAAVANLAVRLGINTAEFESGLKRAESSLGSLAKSIPTLGAVSIASFAVAIKSALSYADELEDTARAADVSTESVINLSKSLEQSGGRGEDAAKILSALTNKLDEAAQGSQKARDAFARAGVSLGDIGSKSNEEVLRKLIDNLSKIEDPVTRNAVAFDLLGKSVKTVDIKNLNQELAEGDGKYTKYAEAVRKAADLHDKLTKSAGETSLAFISIFAPALNTAYTALTQWVLESGSQGGIVYFLSEAFKAVVYAVRLAIDGFRDLVLVVEYGAKQINAALTFDFAKVKSLGEEYLKEHDKLTKARKEFARELLNPSSTAARTPTSGRALLKSDADKKSEAKEQREAAQREKDIVSFGAAQVTLENYSKKLALQRELIGLSEIEVKLRQNIFQIEQTYSSERVKIETALAAEQARGNEADQQRIALLTEQLFKLDELKNKTIELSSAELQRAEVLQKGSEYQKATLPIIFDTQKGIESIGQAYQLAAEGNEAWVAIAAQGFSKLGQQNKAFFNISKALNIALAIQNTYLAATKALASFPPPFNFVAAAVTVAAGLAQVAQISSQQYQGRQTGGRVEAGTPYKVGEQGAETFIPDRSGTILNSAQTRQMGGSGSQIIINNNPGSNFDERVLQTILSNMKIIQSGIQNENVRTFAPNYYNMKG